MHVRYGWIGLGNLGRRLTARLVGDGFDVVVHDLRRELAEPHLARGAEWAATPAAFAGRCDAVVTCLPSPAASAGVLAELLDAMQPGATWIEVSALGRDALIRPADIAAARGVRTLEAPVTGGVHLAAKGRIAVLAGGDPDLVAAHLPALRAMGDRISTWARSGRPLSSRWSRTCWPWSIWSRSARR